MPNLPMRLSRCTIYERMDMKGSSELLAKAKCKEKARTICKVINPSTWADNVMQGNPVGNC
jgi:hypothetical protein